MKNRGLTLVEILVVLAISAIVLSSALIVFNGYRSRNALDSSTQNIARLLLEARSKTISSLGDSKYGVRFASTSVTSFKGAYYFSGDSSNQVFDLDSYVVVSNLSLAGGTTSVIFDRLTGATSQSGLVTVSLVNDPGSYKKIKIDKTGLIELE